MVNISQEEMINGAIKRFINFNQGNIFIHIFASIDMLLKNN